MTPCSLRRGAVLPLVAVCTVLLLAFAAFAIDLGYIFLAKEEMQNTADASSLAGASALNRSERDIAARIYYYGWQNKVAQRGVQWYELDYELGYWNGITRSFHVATGTEPTQPNAVHVRGTRNNLPLFLAPLIGVASSDIVEDAIAVGGAGECAGIWGLIRVNIYGSVVTDSYDSDLGMYGGSNVYANGDLCSCQDLRISGSVEIHGDAMFGAGYSFVGNGARYDVWGRIGEQDCEPPIVDVDFAWAAANHDNGLLRKDDGTSPFRPGHGYDVFLTATDRLVLPGGVYYFDSVKMAGQAVIEVTGPTVIYVDGPADFVGGGIVNMTGDPKNLIIYSNGPDMKLAGGAAFAGAIVAPDCTVDLTGTSDFYGMMLTNEVLIGGTTFIHVDEALVRDVTGIEPIVPILVE